MINNKNSIKERHRINLRMKETDLTSQINKVIQSAIIYLNLELISQKSGRIGSFRTLEEMRIMFLYPWFVCRKRVRDTHLVDT